MITYDLIQGSKEWSLHRSKFLRNASDTPAMLGISPHKKRSELMHERYTGISPEPSEFTQRIFTKGHRFEALARPLAEAIIGDELFPCIGSLGEFSASFDGLTMCEQSAFEHKTLTDQLRVSIPTDDHSANIGAALPEYYRAQMEHQALVSNANHVLFMASVWDDNDALIEERHCYYLPDPVMRARIVAGWVQFEKDLLEYVPPAALPAPAVGVAPDQLPALLIEPGTEITQAQCDAFEFAVDRIIASVPKALVTDVDFETAALVVKSFVESESKIAEYQAALQKQNPALVMFIRVDAKISAMRLTLKKLVDARKEARKIEIAQSGIDDVQAHYKAINAGMPKYKLDLPGTLRTDMGMCLRSLKTVSTMQEAVRNKVADYKSAASQREIEIRSRLDEFAIACVGFEFLFTDWVDLITSKNLEDLRNCIAARIVSYKAVQAEKLRVEAEQKALNEQRIAERKKAADAELERRELFDKHRAEAARINAEANELRLQAEHEEAAQKIAADAAETERLRQVYFTQPSPHLAVLPPRPPEPRIKLGDITARLAPIQFTAADLAALGIHHVEVDRAAKLYEASDFFRICTALETVIFKAKTAVIMVRL